MYICYFNYLHQTELHYLFIYLFIFFVLFLYISTTLQAGSPSYGIGTYIRLRVSTSDAHPVSKLAALTRRRFREIIAENVEHVLS